LKDMRANIAVQISVFIGSCFLLSSCETIKEIRDNDMLGKVGSFELNPVQSNSYWYNGKSYEYKDYEISITSEPVQAAIKWQDGYIGKTPFIYRFTGILDRDERLVIRATPLEGELPAQEAILRIRAELPRKVHFDLRKNKP